MKNKIKELRLSQHLSQEQLAEAAGISVRTLQRLEAGEDVSISTLNAVANALDVPVGDLFQHTTSNEQDTKLQEAKNLQVQMQQRHEEIAVFKKVYNAVYISVMLLVGAALWTAQSFFAEMGLTGIDYILDVAWVAGWMLFGPVRKVIIQTKLNKKLDMKYPLTKTELNKNN